MSRTVRLSASDDGSCQNRHGSAETLQTEKVTKQKRVSMVPLSSYIVLRRPFTRTQTTRPQTARLKLMVSFPDTHLATNSATCCTGNEATADKQKIQEMLLHHMTVHVYDKITCTQE